MRLFDEIERINESAMGFAEPEFRFLDRCSRPEWEIIREELETWFSRYPSDAQAALHSRFRSDNDNHFRSAFFELFLHELLLKLECTVEIHPQLGEGTTRSPDFLAHGPSKTSFYLEACLATDESDEQAGVKAVMNSVYDLLNEKLNSPNFLIGMNLYGSPTTQPSARRIINFLEKGLQPLDPDQIGDLYKKSGFGALPKLRYKHEDWEIEFYPIPKSTEARGKTNIRPIAAWGPGEAQAIRPQDAIRNAVVDKASAYGQLDLPYIIAVNALGEYVQGRLSPVTQALFGTEGIGGRVSPNLESREMEPIRFPDGAFWDNAGPKHTRVSAVLVTASVFPSHIPRASIWLCHNPWAIRPYSSELTRLPQLVPEEDHLVEVKGESIGEILGLPTDWLGL